jgi:hypothetical protein
LFVATRKTAARASAKTEPKRLERLGGRCRVGHEPMRSGRHPSLEIHGAVQVSAQLLKMQPGARNDQAGA